MGDAKSAPANESERPNWKVGKKIVGWPQITRDAKAV